MTTLTWVRALFAVAAVYDGILGIAFIIAGPAMFAWFGITPPNHWGYIHFPAGLLVVFALMFLAVARNPAANRNLIPYGILLKVCYVATAGSHWALNGIPVIWKPFVVFDILFAVLFVLAYRTIARGRAR